ncbi:alpha/beta hydrolase [Paenibacillus sp. 7124]|uniref:Alpha/beta hydrolase n=1 Tax=Paenibacillus apii TaxID=1850370 RepID=A0A6M1PPJ1_9BACL|nr:alpha/beta hydrolase [Paenibacillus apii]NGM84324.1 alpha/beta hydrolase [Paenibacillus apii]NJJ38274.1 alpha/beta hydrolase [Paenibacillus apii]
MADKVMKYITLPSHWGREVRHKYYSQESDTLVVVFPGRNYPAELPLLHYAGKSALEYGCDLLLLEYGYQSARVDLKREEMGIIEEECGRALSSVPGYKRLLFIGKSIGSVIAGRLAADYDPSVQLDCLYLTPLPETIPYIKRTGGTVIYGGGDPLFSEEDTAGIRGLTDVSLYRIDEANHSLEVGSVNESLAVLIVVNNLVHEFFRGALGS